MSANNTVKILSGEEIKSSILKGIENAKGTHDAMTFLTETDCIKLGEELANREAYRKTHFFSVVVNPINEIEEGKNAGHYDWIYEHITGKTVPLQNATDGEKRIYFVPVNETVPEGKEAEFLAKFGKKPVKNAPNYLLGVMAKLEEKDLPEELKLKDFVAVSEDEKEVFQSAGGFRCFLLCDRRSGERGLSVVRLADGWDADDVWYFLAEDL